MFDNHSNREKIYLGLVLLVLIGFLLNNWALQKTQTECLEANTKLNQYILDISNGKIQPTYNQEGWTEREYSNKNNLSFNLPNN